MTKQNFMIYGSYGYTGELIAQLAIEQGLRPILAGRDKQKLSAQAAKLNLEYVVLDLDNETALIEALTPLVAVIHCAGPFIRTYKAMADACLKAHTHYMDITGEVDVFEALMKLDDDAKAAKVMLLPGAGFDVVPSDCLAQHVKSRLMDANELIIAIYNGRHVRGKGTGISRGTAKTMLNGLTHKTLMRDEGVLKPITAEQENRLFTFDNKKQKICKPISWGDLATAWWSTGIPHIETYMTTTPKAVRIFKLISPIKFLFKISFVKRYIESKLNEMPEGPTKAMRQNAFINILAEASNKKGLRVASMLVTPDGYDFTAAAAISIVKRILANNAPVGFQTPSTAYGKDFVLTLPGVTREDI